MKTWIKVLIITILIGAPALPLGRIIWTPSPDANPTAAQKPFFIFLSVVEALLLGLGVAFIIFGWKLVKNSSQQKRALTLWAYVSLAWLLVSWWPHDNLHIHNAMNMQGLLYIEYGFHMTLVIASLILTYYFIDALKSAGHFSKSRKKSA